MKILCKVMPDGLKPMYGSDWDEKRKLKVGSVVWATVRQSRNYKHLKKFFALCELLAQNMPEGLAEEWHIRKKEDVENLFKRDLGYINVYRNERGEAFYDYQHIDYESMTQDKFDLFYERCVDLAQHVYIKRMHREDMESEIINFM